MLPGCTLEEPPTLPEHDREHEQPVLVDQSALTEAGLTRVYRTDGDDASVLSVRANLTVRCTGGRYQWRVGDDFTDWTTHPADDAAGAAVQRWLRAPDEAHRVINLAEISAVSASLPSVRCILECMLISLRDPSYGTGHRLCGSMGICSHYINNRTFVSLTVSIPVRT